MGVEILDKNRRLVADLGNAADVGYDMVLNDVSTASFSLPFGDSKNKFCQPRKGYVRIDEDGKHTELFRIMSKTMDKGGSNLIAYECDHVITTLADSIMPRYHHYGGRGYYTRQVLEYVLSFQPTKHWRLGRCAFSRQFEYETNDENLLFALFDVPRTFSKEYKWVFDTSAYPWTLHLDELDTKIRPECYCSYGKNLNAITKTEDPSELTTRIYCYGAGEGVNQLTIERVNPTKKMYIDAPKAVMDEYGDPIVRVFTDRRFTVEESLFERGRTLLEYLQKPRIEYTIEMADLEPMTGNPLDKPWPGKVIRVENEEIGEDVKTFITAISKRDIFRERARVAVTLANQPEDIAGTLSSIADRQKIEALYSQGSTSFMQIIAERDAGKDLPVVLPLYIPGQVRIINGVMLQVTLDYYVMTATTTESGGGETATSSSGGGETATSSDGGEASSTSESGGAVEDLELDTGALSSGETATKRESGVFRAPTSIEIAIGTNHYHETLYTVNVADGAISNLVSHAHGIAHKHKLKIAAHKHAFKTLSHAHKIVIKDHTHKVTIKAHAHTNKPGISRGPRANSFTVKVGDKAVSWPAGTSVMDIAPYLSGVDGMIPRDRYIDITITPQPDASNPDGLAWIRAVATPVVFMGADYGQKY